MKTAVCSGFSSKMGMNYIQFADGSRVYGDKEIRRHRLVAKATALVEADNYKGICLDCEAIQDRPIDPDERQAWCSVCDGEAVYGAAEVLLVFTT